MVVRRNSKSVEPKEVQALPQIFLAYKRRIDNFMKIHQKDREKLATMETLQLPMLTLTLSIFTLLLSCGRFVGAKDVDYKPEDDPCHPQLPPCLPPGQAMEVTRYEGEFAEIKCLVYGESSNKESQVVQFGRTSTVVPIALGREVFLDNDKRYSVVHENGSALWTFVIDFLRLDDAGQYECNVQGKVIFYKLRVKPLPPATKYSAYEDGKNMYIRVPKFVREGSSFHVSCFCKVGIGQDTVYLDWFRRGEPVSTSSDKGIKIAKGWYDTNGGELRVTMKFAYALPEISGIYECRFIRGKYTIDSIKAEIRVRQRRRDFRSGRNSLLVLPSPERMGEAAYTSSPNDVYRPPKKGEYKHVTQNDSPGGRNAQRGRNNRNVASRMHHQLVDVIFFASLLRVHLACV